MQYGLKIYIKQNNLKYFILFHLNSSYILLKLQQYIYFLSGLYFGGSLVLQLLTPLPLCNVKNDRKWFLEETQQSFKLIFQQGNLYYYYWIWIYLSLKLIYFRWRTVSVSLSVLTTGTLKRLKLRYGW